MILRRFITELRTIKLLGLAASTGFGVLVLFQNCSSAPFAANSFSVAGTGYCVGHPDDAACVQPQSAECVFNGSGVGEGESVFAYQNSLADQTCVGETRVCHAGALGGSFAFAKCSTAGSASCLFNGRTVASGESVTAYLNSSAPAGASCTSEIRVCERGVLSGSMNFDKCQSAVAQSCLFDGRTVDHGASVVAFGSSAVPAGQKCQPLTRTCFNGALSGAGTFASCHVDAAAGCLFAGTTVADGQQVFGFVHSTVPAGQKCVANVRVCRNGSLNGVGNYASCDVDQPRSCLINGQTVANGQTITLYSSAQSDGAGVCASERRACKDGVLEGAAALSECVDPAADLTVPFARVSASWFVPNQIAGDIWNRPDGQPLNGHIEGSFSDLTRWPNLQAHLRANSGGLGTFSSEIGYMSNVTLTSLRRSHLAVQVEAPSWTHCVGGWEIARAELGGDPTEGPGFFCRQFGICSPSDRRDPKLNGWMTTREGHLFNPEEVVLDERIPNLLPNYNTNNSRRLFQPGLSWEERKQSLVDPCQGSDPNPGEDRLTGLIYDYVEYARVLKARSPATDLSFHWNVNAGWEWRDLECLEGVNARHPEAGAFEGVFMGLSEPCFKSNAVLKRLVKALCDDGECPKAVYMDVDFDFNTNYALRLLRMNKDTLRELNVDFGLNVVNSCDKAPNQVLLMTADRTELKCTAREGTPNAVNEESVLNVIDFTSRHGILDASTRLRFASWTTRPVEQGARVAESIPNSWAWTANRIFEEYLIPRGFAN